MVAISQSRNQIRTFFIHASSRQLFIQLSFTTKANNLKENFQSVNKRTIQNKKGNFQVNRVLKQPKNKNIFNIK